MSAPESAPVGDVEACCEHSLRWHHEERGCGYHGFAPEHRCPCLLTFDEALAADRARVRAETLAEVREQIKDVAATLGHDDVRAALGEVDDLVRGMAEAGEPS